MSAKLNLLLVALVALAALAPVFAQYEGYIYAPRKLKDPMRAKGDDRTLVPEPEVEDDEEEYITDSLVAAASNSINAKLAAPDSKQQYNGPDLVAAGDNQGSQSEDKKQGKNKRRRRKKNEDEQSKSEQSEVEVEKEQGSEKKEQENQGQRFTHAKGVKLADKFRELNREHDKHSDVKNDAGERHKNYIKIYHRETSARIKKLATPEDEKVLEQQLAAAETASNQQQMEPSPSDNTQVETPTPGPSSSPTPTESTNGAQKADQKGNLLDQMRAHLGGGGKNRAARRKRRKNNKKNGKNNLVASGEKPGQPTKNNNGGNKRRRRRRRKPKKSGNPNRRRLQRKPQNSQEETNEPPK